MSARGRALTIVLSAVVAVGACGGDGDVTAPNNPPVASAGTDQDVSRGTPVTLHGSASDADGQPLTFTWTQISGPGVGTLAGAEPTFTAPDDVLTLEFDVVASDGRESSAADRVVIWVLENAEAGALWVAPTGHDGDAGTRAAPKLTIQAAVNAATSSADVYVAAGTYAQTAPLTLRIGVSIYGGFNPTTFLRNAAVNETVIEGVRTALSGSGAHGVTLDGLSIRSANGTTGARTSTGISLTNSDNVIIARNRITVGNGAAGTIGALSALAAPGINGGDASGSTRGGGASGTGWRGGNGGTGGFDADLFCTTDGSTGESGLGPRGGAGGAGSSSDGAGVVGERGGAGNDGASGSGGGAFGSITAGAYVPPSGGAGSSGTAGSGGGGGGGGDCVVTGFLTAYPGGGGGGGGAGGSGRAGSGGGDGGGGSFGIVIIGASTGVTIISNEITTGNGGAGGQGASSGVGGTAGSGGSGGDPDGGGGVGGRGGSGGTGGWGGAGGGGGGGPSIGVVEDASSSSNLTASDLATNTITVGAAGSGGAGGLKADEGTAPAGADGLRKQYEKRPPPPATRLAS